MRWRPVTVWLICALLGSASPAYALKIAPFKARLHTDQNNPTQVFRVENNSEEPAAVQVDVMSWSISPEGEEKNSEAEDEFIIFPAQMVLKPHESRSVRIQWQGSGPVPVERAYRVIVEQVPVALRNTPESGSAIRIMLKFKAALYLRPKNPTIDIKVERFEQIDDQLRLYVRNEGTEHSLLKNAVLTLTTKNNQHLQFSGDALKNLEGENVHAGALRIFNLPLPLGMQEPLASVKLGFEKLY